MRPTPNFTPRVQEIARLIQSLDTLEEVAAVQKANNGQWDRILSVASKAFKVGEHISWFSQSRRYYGHHQGVVVGLKGVNLLAVSNQGVQWTLAATSVTRLQPVESSS